MNEYQLNLKQKVAFVAVLCFLCSLPILWLVKERVDKEAENQKAQTALRVERENEARAKAKLVKPASQKKRKTKMVKIVSGKTGVADANGIRTGTGFILNSFRVTTLDDHNDTPPIAQTGDGSAWSVTEDGVINVPLGTANGIYYAFYATGYTEDGPPVVSINAYEFEVVCMKVTLRSYTRSLP